jgi:hypothetical protein
LEDLERRAGTSDESSSTGSEKQGQTPSTKSSKKSSKSSKPGNSQKVAASQPPQFTPPMNHEDEMMFPTSYDDRERSHTPPFMPYSAYPPPDEVLLPPYGSHQSYHPMTTADGYPSYTMATTVPCTLPSMTHFSDAIKREAYPEEAMSPYMNYNGFVPSMDVNAHHNPYDNSNPHVSSSHLRHHHSTISSSQHGRETR